MDRSLRDSEFRCLCSCSVSFVAQPLSGQEEIEVESVCDGRGWYTSSESFLYISSALSAQATYGTKPLCSIHNLRPGIICGVKWIVCM